jgi:hypothetical protein
MFFNRQRTDDQVREAMQSVMALERAAPQLSSRREKRLLPRATSDELRRSAPSSAWG